MPSGDAPIDRVAHELYVLPPEQFVAARDARVREAREAGDRSLAEALARLRRPSISAWVVNLLVDAQPDLADRLLALGRELRQAQRDLAGQELRELAIRRQRMIRLLLHDARRLAARGGHPIGTGITFEVEQTLHAALSDPDVAQQVRLGRLTKPFSRTGISGSMLPLPNSRPAPATEQAAAEPGPEIEEPDPLAGAVVQFPAPLDPDERFTLAFPTGPEGQQAFGGNGWHPVAVDDRAAAEQAERAERERVERERVEREQVRRRAERDRVRADRDAIDQALAAAEDSLADAARRLGDAEHAKAEATALVADLRRQLAAAEAAVRDTTARERDSRRGRDATERARDELARRLADLTDRLAEYSDLD